ncbi:hypothetical protein MM239_12620 [Belliella sp. DSM 111904]|uniref:Uncharacterized protein n=1 Tax=Belliella filtrata TaxID=2923435 RepID=A0ABS9V2N8_9BACT|nr:hypothetical protein [Belliella filtrata]MCH7410243.1 hypothetical protein [Belliella filtrata]
METRCKTRMELANEYGVDRKTFRRMLERVGVNLTSGLVTPTEQSLIFEKLGIPEKMKKRILKIPH